MSERRTRADGTRTFTTEEWDRRWYWPVGTRVTVAGEPGTVSKQNGVTVIVKLDNGRTTSRVSMDALQRGTDGR